MPAERPCVVSIIVPTRNSGRTLRACLASIRRQSYPSLELIVVDNHSNDETVNVARSYADQIDMVGPERSTQRNHGAGLSTGSLLLFLDSDMVLEPEVVADSVAAMERSGMPAVVIPEISFGSGFWAQCRILERACYSGDDAVEAARLYERTAFFEAGGFDAALVGPEDWDLSRRVSKGRRLPRAAALIHHDEGRITLRSAFTKRRYYAPGYLRYFRKHGRAAITQANPLMRAAYLRHWRELSSHPVLSGGMLLLKLVELTAVLQVLAEHVSGGRGRAARPRSGGSAGSDRLRTALRPLLVTFGSILEPDGGLQVRSRVLAESLTRLNLQPAIVSTREGAATKPPPPWARALRTPSRKPTLGFSIELARLIRELAGESDIVIVSNAMFMPALTLSRTRLPMVWDTNECQTLHYRRLAPTVLNRLKYLVWLALERWAARRCCMAVAISESEAVTWRRTYPQLRDKVVTVDHAAFVPVSDSHVDSNVVERVLGARPTGPVLLFVGTMRAKHNAAAAHWIVDVLAPALPASTTLLICGPGSEAFQPQARVAGGRVSCLGTVVDIDSLIASADLCLAPLAAGAGVKTKVLHYLAHGRRVAGTPLAFEGLEGSPGLFAAPLAELPALVTCLSQQTEPTEQADTRARAQKEWIRRHHGSDHVAGQWRDAVARVLV